MTTTVRKMTTEDIKARLAHARIDPQVIERTERALSEADDRINRRRAEALQRLTRLTERLERDTLWGRLRLVFGRL